MKNCNNIQESLDWCMGTPELPGIMRRIYYIAKSNIVRWPQMPRTEKGQVIEPVVYEDFIPAADAYWHYIDILEDKSQLTSEAQGENYAQTQLNKLTAFHPGTGAEATAAAAYINNTDNVFIVQDKAGRYRIVGSENWTTKNTVTMDLGQGPTGTPGTTISVEAPDEVPAPFYHGVIVTEDGPIDCGGDFSKVRIISFSSSGPSDDEVVVVSGNYTTVSPVTYEGKQYTTALKMETNTKISFETKRDGTIHFWAAPDDAKCSVKIDGKTHSVNATNMNFNLSAGEHLITKQDTCRIVLIVIS